MNVSPLLITEALGFSPKLFLDDVINVANQAVQDGVNGMEEFLQKWMDQRVERLGVDWDRTREVEQGLVAFQTLLEHHTDIAFDFFEVWSLRNIFDVPLGLPVALTHHTRLDLYATAEREEELMDEVEQLRKKIDAQRKLKRVLCRAVRASGSQRRRAEQRLEQLSILGHPSVDTLKNLPRKLEVMYGRCSSLFPFDAAMLSALSQVELSEPGKRPWESTKTGYLKWAIEQLSKVGGKGGKQGEVDGLVMRTDQVGSTDHLRRAIKVDDDDDIL
ncbi:hypothetical protein P691DRAFT_680857 [Macrolepiota fuliginosa MF-IS2]|uniref:Mis12-domain-containing protein n=1 Tax=Macrolepiota fuliginosa MF-IS2 TaxID=1400762 RepID=A0A9P5X3L1_9AGAR|nr:hypothetical protein P691DRAFT_680857 [Macrolepiota fuliginosa MF-IS2]